MSAHSNEEVAEVFDAEQLVADHLRENPDFFENHLDVLGALEVPHPCGQATSLIERQLELYRNDNRDLRHRLDALTHVARDNEQLSQRMHRFTLAIMGTKNMDQLMDVVDERLNRDFRACASAVRILADVPGENDSPRAFLDETDRAVPVIRPFMTSSRPVCGKLKPEQIAAVFGGDVSGVRSSAIVPLTGEGFSGILGIASHDAKHYQRGIGTLFLSQLGELLSQVIRRHR